MHGVHEELRTDPSTLAVTAAWTCGEARVCSGSRLTVLTASMTEGVPEGSGVREAGDEARGIRCTWPLERYTCGRGRTRVSGLWDWFSGIRVATTALEHAASLVTFLSNNHR